METNENTKAFAICGVCSGKGGWKKQVNSIIDNNWEECPMCDSLGFYEQDQASLGYESVIFNYTKYKKLITELLVGTVAQVQEFHTDDMGKTIKMKILPYSKTIFSQFVDYILRLGHFSGKLDIQLAQMYSYSEPQKRIVSYWEITLSTNDLSNLDGFIDTIRFWDSNKRSLANNEDQRLF